MQLFSSAHSTNFCHSQLFSGGLQSARPAGLFCAEETNQNFSEDTDQTEYGNGTYAVANIKIESDNSESGQELNAAMLIDGMLPFQSTDVSRSISGFKRDTVILSESNSRLLFPD